jgi:alkanesulfonate monooxygenase SsuD/methylene tetrahydromethanopterin reductase-like flavin-dependent oxidoreductase (luciferase family)
MELGLFSLLPRRDMSVDVRTIYDENVQTVRLVEEIGFDVAWFAEHHFGNYCMCASPLVLAAYMAARTERIRLGTGVLVLPLYHPLRVLEEIGMVDNLSGGRLVLGVGSGYQVYEFERFGVDLADNWAMTHEFLDIIEMGLAEGRVAYDGRFYKVPESAIGSRPLQNPIPTYVTGNQPDYLRRAGQRGYTPFVTVGPQPTAAIERVKAHILQHYGGGHDAASLPFALQRAVYVAGSRAEALRAAEEQLYTGRLVMAFRGRYEKLDGVEIVPQPFDNEPTPEQIVDNVMIGDAETVAERLVAELRKIRPCHLSLFTQAGAISGADARRSLERFGRDVLPMVERELGPLAEFGPQPARVAAE